MRKLVIGSIVMLLVNIAMYADIKLKVKDGKELVLSKKDNVYDLSDGENKWSLIKDKDFYSFITNHNELGSGKFKEKKIKFVKTNFGKYFDLKLKEDKIKITIDEQEWSIKTYDDKIKLKLGETTYGKVKYYLETSKTKFKNQDGDTLVETKDLKSFSTILAPFGIANIKEEKRYCIILILYSLQNE